jgi:hypothetical protein
MIRPPCSYGTQGSGETHMISERLFRIHHWYVYPYKKHADISRAVANQNLNIRLVLATIYPPLYDNFHRSYAYSLLLHNKDLDLTMAPCSSSIHGQSQSVISASHSTVNRSH